VTGSRNAIYESKMRAQGFKKVTVWVSEESEPEFKLMAKFCCENREHIPFMARSLITGKMKKGV
jgi:hypothetical protein